MELNELEKNRAEKINAMRSQGIAPYPTRSEVDHSIRQALDAFTQFEADHQDESFSETFILGGRIRSIRSMGKLAFAHIEDGSGRIQIMLRLNELGEEALAQFKDYFDLGDFIQAGGTLMRSRTGEVTLLVSSFKMLAKAVSPLPAAKDEEVDGQIIRHATSAIGNALPPTLCRPGDQRGGTRNLPRALGGGARLAAFHGQPRFHRCGTPS
jgi:lysyl-tRNA synthetase class 2